MVGTGEVRVIETEAGVTRDTEISLKEIPTSKEGLDEDPGREWT